MHPARPAPIRLGRDCLIRERDYPKWVPARYRIDEEFNCLTNSERLADRNPSLTWVVGRARRRGSKKWGDHAWCETPAGQIVDPYFRHRFPDHYQEIECQRDSTAFDEQFDDRDFEAVTIA